MRRRAGVRAGRRRGVRADPGEVDVGVESQSCHAPSLPHGGDEREARSVNPPWIRVLRVGMRRHRPVRLGSRRSDSRDRGFGDEGCASAAAIGPRADRPSCCPRDGHARHRRVRRGRRRERVRTSCTSSTKRMARTARTRDCTRVRPPVRDRGGRRRGVAARGARHPRPGAPARRGAGRGGRVPAAARWRTRRPGPRSRSPWAPRPRRSSCSSAGTTACALIATLGR